MKRELLNMLDELQEKRVLEVNYEELKDLIEFLFLHCTDFKVFGIDDEKDYCMISI